MFPAGIGGAHIGIIFASAKYKKFGRCVEAAIDGIFNVGFYAVNKGLI